MARTCSSVATSWAVPANSRVVEAVAYGSLTPDSYTLTVGFDFRRSTSATVAFTVTP